MASDAEARIWAVLGASGSGKGLWAKQQLRELAPPRLVVWDFMNEYGEFVDKRYAVATGTTLATIQKAMVTAGDGPLRIRYCPRGTTEKQLRAEFEALCELVYAWENCTFIAEELANVTTPGWAPASWKKMCTSGRHQRVHIIGFSQTPALIDKTFLGNCTLIHCGPLREFNHRQAVAKSMDIDEGRIALLVKLQWLEKDFDSGKVTTGWVAKPGGRKRATVDVAPTGPSPTGRGRRAPSVEA
jgi:hypothetical protein